MIEKERKDWEREEAKRAKGRDREGQRLLGLQKKEELQKSDDAVRGADKHQSKKNDKARQLMRKDVNAEVKRSRGEANLLVLQFFDDEEEGVEVAELSSSGYDNRGVVDGLDHSSSSSSIIIDCSRDVCSSVQQYLQGTALKKEELLPVGGGKQGRAVSWDDVFQVTSTLHVFRRHLHLEDPVVLDSVISSLQAVSLAASSSTTASSSSDVVDRTDSSSGIIIVKEDVSSHMVKGEESEEHTLEDPLDQSSHQSVACAVSAVEVAVADTDKVQLQLMSRLIDSLKDTLDIDDAADEGQQHATKDNSKAQKDASTVVVMERARFPLNQLTWPELARLVILQHVLQELGYDKLKTQHCLRGSRGGGSLLHSKSGKSIVRLIRHRLAVRSRPTTPSIGAADESSMHSDRHPAVTGMATFAGSPISNQDRLLLMPLMIRALRSGGADLDRLELAAECVQSSSSSSVKTTAATAEMYFSSEKEISSQLQQCSVSQSTHTEAYRRCCKVLLRLLSLPQAKPFIWEVDCSAHADYYSIIKTPVTYMNIADSLLNKLYGQEDTQVFAKFCRDLLQVVINCVTYNSEDSPLVAQAQSLLLASYRYLERWIDATPRPALSLCDDRFCLLSQQFIDPSLSSSSVLKCGRCSGSYSKAFLDHTGTGQASPSTHWTDYRDFYLKPSATDPSPISPEWFCPLCLREDSETVLMMLQLHDGGGGHHQQQLLRGSIDTAPFHFDEWGFSNTIPWLFNACYSSMAQTVRELYPHLLPHLDALYVLSNTGNTAVLGRHHLASASSSSSSSSASSSSSSNSAGTKQTWTFCDRLTVLVALCSVLRSSGRSIELMKSLADECDKLLQISSKSSFREADFMTIVKETVGDEGVAHCRTLLDGYDGSAEVYLHNLVTEGRCVVCNGSTFEDDMMGPTPLPRKANIDGSNDVDGLEKEKLCHQDNDMVMLCDGCNAEVHLKCLNLQAVRFLSCVCML